MLSTFLKELRDDTSGATAIEYGLIVALIALAIAAALQALAWETIELWTSIDSKVTDSIGDGPKTPPAD